jgi:hypothetical protein
MRARAALASSNPDLPATNVVTIRRVVTGGTIVGVVGAVAFATVHAVAILPIWSRIPGGLIQAIPVGIALVWAFEHLVRTRGWRTPAHGAVYGTVLFLTLVPGTAFSNALRLAGIAAGEWPGTLGSLAVAAAAGWIAGWILTREVRASRALAVATAVFTIGASGPIPVVNGPRAAWLFAGFIPICVLAGIAAAISRGVLRSAEGERLEHPVA